MSEKLTDRHGFEYYMGLPSDAIRASLRHFHRGGVKKVGMEYYLQSGAFPLLFEVNKMTQFTTADQLRPFIETQQLYVRKKDI